MFLSTFHRLVYHFAPHRFFCLGLGGTVGVPGRVEVSSRHVSPTSPPLSVSCLSLWSCLLLCVSLSPSVSLFLQDRMAEQKGALEKSERDLRFAMPRNVASGLDAVERLVKEQVRFARVLLVLLLGRKKGLSPAGRG